MATFKFEGLEEYISQMQKMVGITGKMIEDAVDEGAGLVADEVRQAIDRLPVDDRYYATERKGLKRAQVIGLYNSFGVAPIRNDNGFINRKLGFDGYNNLKSKKWPKGQPNSMVARSINSGTSFLPKTGFMDKATKAVRAECERAMRDSIDKSISKEIKN